MLLYKSCINAVSVFILLYNIEKVSKTVRSEDLKNRYLRLRGISKIWPTGFRLPMKIVSLGDSCPERPNKQPSVEKIPYIKMHAQEHAATRVSRVSRTSHPSKFYK